MTTEEGCGKLVMTPIVLMGLSYGMFAGSLWTALVYVVSETVVGVATGFTSFAICIGISVI